MLYRFNLDGEGGEYETTVVDALPSVPCPARLMPRRFECQPHASLSAGL